MTAHWGLPDLTAVAGSDSEVAIAFSEAYRMLNARLSIFVSLPMKLLDRLSLQKRLEEIGKSKTRAQVRHQPLNEQRPKRFRPAPPR